VVQAGSSAFPFLLRNLPVFNQRHIRKVSVLPDKCKHHPGDAFPQVRPEIDFFKDTLFVPVAEVIAGDSACGKEQALLQDVLAEPVSYCRVKRGFYPEDEKTCQMAEESFPREQVPLLGPADQSSLVIQGERPVFRSNLFVLAICCGSQT
jgi:hypothetical protein